MGRDGHGFKATNEVSERRKRTEGKMDAPVQSRENLIALWRISFQEIGMAATVAREPAGEQARAAEAHPVGADLGRE